MALSRRVIVGLAAASALALAAPATAEWNLDVYAGPTYEHDDSDPGELTVGGRVGYFFSLIGPVDFGLFADSSAVFDDDDDEGTDFRFVPTTALALLRYRLFETEGLGIHPYFGAGPSVVWSEYEAAGSDDDEVDLGLDARAGLRAILLDHFALFAEYRLNYFEADFDFSQPGVGDVDDVFHAALFGVGYRFIPAPPPPPPPAPAPEPVAAAAPLPPPTKKKIVLRGVTFEFDRAQLTPAATGVLDAAVAALGEAPDAEVIVEGHTDAVGSDTYNMGLSQRRADSVRDYLVDKGVAADRLETRAFGESMPVADNDTAEGRAHNRRVELDGSID